MITNNETSRRSLIAGAVGASASVSSPTGPARGASLKSVRFLPGDDPGQSPHGSEPLPSRSGYVDAAGARLFYRDTGGSGAPIVLLHAATGATESWAFQFGAFADAGLRAIAYARRGYPGSQGEPGGSRRVQVDDLAAVLTGLGLSSAHILGTAAGAFTAMQFAVAFPARTRTLTLASSLVGLAEPDFTRRLAFLLPADFQALPADFRELGPSYRMANPEGSDRWRQIERTSRRDRTAPPAPGAQSREQMRTAGLPTWDDVQALRPPTHIISGDADLYAPPAVGRVLQQRVPGSELTIIGEAGHSAHWEQPRPFNHAVLEFVARRGRAGL